MINERMSHLLRKIWLKKSKINFFLYVLYRFFNLKNQWFSHSLFLVSNVSESIRLLTKNEQCERIAQVAHQKWAMWAICSGRSPKMRDHERIAKAHQKWANERIACFFERIAHLLIFSQKTSDSLGKPMSKFQALQLRWYLRQKRLKTNISSDFPSLHSYKVLWKAKWRLW